MNFPLSCIYSFLKHAIEKEKENAVWEMWLSVYPDMIKKRIEFKSFEKFKSEVMKPQVKYSNKSEVEILAEMTAIEEKYRSQRSQKRGDQNRDI